MRPPKDSVYSVWQQHFDSYEEGLKALNSQCKTLKRLLMKHPFCVFIMGLSVHDAKYAKKISIKDGKRGRPKIGFVPKAEHFINSYKDGVHIHIYIGGYYAATLATEFVRIQNKLYQNKKHKNHVHHSAILAVKNQWDTFPINYVERQSSRLRYSDKKAVQHYAEKRNKFTRLLKKPHRITRNARLF